MLLFAVTAWGGSFVAARMVLSPQVPGSASLTPKMLAAVRFVLASFIFLPLLYWQHRRVKPLAAKDIPAFLVLGQVGISIYFWLQYTGVRLTSASISSVLVVGLIPLATMVVSGLVLREPLGGRRALALAFGAIGVFVVAGQKGLKVAIETGFLLGSLCLVANALCFAAYSTMIRGIRSRYGPLTITAATNISGTIGLVLISMVSEDPHTLALLSRGQWGAIVFLGVVCSVMAYFAYNYALVQVEASKAAVWLYLESPVAMVLGALVLGEPVTAQTIIGGFIILSSLYFTQRS
jgi:drug/metabolite transporter (DMT)-like permease